MGDIEYFLGTLFTWLKHKDGKISVAFTEFTAHQFLVHTTKKVPNMTPYCSGFYINSIPPVEYLYPDLTCRRQVYQSIFGFINWLATCTRPEIAPTLTFLALYINALHPQPYKAAFHALKWPTITNECGIHFHSHSSSKIQAFNNFPHHHYREAYTEATYPLPSECHQRTAFCDANWGGKFGSAVEYGTTIELFKFRSLSGFIICRSGGPIAYKSFRLKKPP